MQNSFKKMSPKYPNIFLRMTPGHFITPNSHINYYMDMTNLKCRQKEAAAVAQAMSAQYSSSTIVDSIVCLEGMEVIGAYLADDLTKAGILSQNAHKTMYILCPEFNSYGQIIFRDNNLPMIKGKNVLIILPAITTGNTLNHTISAISYYGGKVVGVSAIFSAATRVQDHPVYSLFGSSDLPDYMSYLPEKCPLCADGIPVDALANGYGYSRIN